MEMIRQLSLSELCTNAEHFSRRSWKINLLAILGNERQHKLLDM